MTHRTHDMTTGVRLVLRAVGVAFASALMFLLLAVLNGGGTAEASAQPAGLGDLLGGTGALGSVLAPIVDPVDDVVAPILEPVTQPVTPVVAPVTDTVAPLVDPLLNGVARPVVDSIVPVTDTVVPVLDTVVRPVAEIVAAPVNDTVGPIVAPIVTPIVDVVVPVVRPVADTVEPIVDTVIPPADGPVRPPATGPVGPDDGLPVPDGSAPSPQPGSQPAVTPDPIADPVPAATVEDLVAIESPTAGVLTGEAAPTFAVSPRTAESAAAPSGPASAAGILERIAVATEMPADSMTTPPGVAAAQPASFPARSSGPELVRSVVNGLLSGAPSPSPTPGAPSSLLAVLTATVAALVLYSRRVTTEVSWRSALVFSSVERPG